MTVLDKGSTQLNQLDDRVRKMAAVVLERRVQRLERRLAKGWPVTLWRLRWLLYRIRKLQS